MESRTLRRNIVQRLFGICATKPPEDEDCWGFQNQNVVVDLERVPEIAEPNRAVRLEKKGTPHRFLLIHGNDGRYHAFKNRCTHGGRRLDPVPGTEHVQCCSIGRSTYNYSGNVLSGPAKGPIDTCAVHIEDGKLVIEVEV
ncbi:MAG: Rieske 2Fe-2S domain-containing protein [Deltaproteobacteria bacterium]|jgi:nitrite reductase/ring-hydroxylating ferredoxin subunit|nr:Rieske 2Fe-2S domain-containing protein [Deltaproteobacteria bacterium]